VINQFLNEKGATKAGVNQLQSFKSAELLENDGEN
jgi:hypothetical protein